MNANLRRGLVMVLFTGLMGCSRTREPQPVEPKAAEALLGHWRAIEGGDWKTAFDRLHPDVKTSTFTLKQFSQVHARRRGTQGLPREIAIAGAERSGDDLVVSFDLMVAPSEGGPLVAVFPQRKATLRKTGDSWGLMTHDLLAVGP